MVDLLPQSNLTFHKVERTMKRQGETAVESSDISRQSLARLMRSYLADEISAFRFDESLQAFSATKDPVVREVACLLWYFYDDLTDHHVRLGKPEWDLNQRLLLVLESDCRVETDVKRIWSFRQLLALAALLLFAWAAYVTGWGDHIPLVAFPFGLVALALLSIPPESKSNDDPFQPIVWPFASFADLARAYDSSNFRKTRYPKEVERRFEDFRKQADRFWSLRSQNGTLYFSLMFCSPFWLVYLALPETRRSTLFRMD
ncbi:hypothetical protein GC170_07870 [bacterium]|nr:hypothetical protein [bacterium]